MLNIHKRVASYFISVGKKFKNKLPDKYNMRLPLVLIVWAFLGVTLVRSSLIPKSVPFFVKNTVYYSFSLLLCLPLLRSLKEFFTLKELLSYSTYNIRLKGNQQVPHIIYFIIVSVSIPILSLVAVHAGILNSLSELGLINTQAQNLDLIHLSKTQFIAKLADIALVPIEDLVNLVVFVYIFKLLSKKWDCNLVLVSIITSLLFGAFHYPAWGTLDVVLGVGVSYFFSFLLFVYTRNMWILICTHLWQDVGAVSGMYSDELSNFLFSSAFLIGVMVLALGLLYFGIFGVVNKKSNNNNSSKEV